MEAETRLDHVVSAQGSWFHSTKNLLQTMQVA